MTAKEYLSKIQRSRYMMEKHAERMEELYHVATGLKAIVYDTDRVQTSPENQMENVFAMIDAEAHKYAKARIRYEKEVRKRMEQIGKLDNVLYIKVLTLRYIDGMRWEEIACQIGYSFRHVTRIHGEALAAFTAMYKDVLLCPRE